MDSVQQALVSTLFPGLVLFLAVIILAVVGKVIKNNYIKIPPHEVVVISGRKGKANSMVDSKGNPIGNVGYRLVHGGATLVWPFFERVDKLDLRTITIANLEIKDAITKEGVPLTIKAVANLKIGSEEALLMNAVERLTGKTSVEIREMAYETLEGHVRSMLGALTVEEVIGNRHAFQQNMINESQADLSKLGLKIDILTVKELTDKNGYLDALGKQKIAEVKRDADIGSAQAGREATIKSTTAGAEGEKSKQANLTIEAEAERDKQIKIASFLYDTNAAQARAAQAGPLATAKARKEVVESEQAVELARTQTATLVAQAEADRKQQELISTEIRPAEAKKAAAIAEAEGKAAAIKIEAVAEQERLIAEGRGKAEAKKLEMLAEAEGIKAKLLAEAEGVEKKAEAYTKLNQSGQLLQILEAGQTLIPNSIKEFAKVVDAAAKPLGDVDRIMIMDSGSGGNGYSGSAIERFSNVAPNFVFGLLQKLITMGVDVEGLAKHAGLTNVTEKTAESNGKAETATTPQVS